MDRRSALRQGDILRFRNHENGTVVYKITNEIGRGRSCIAYEGVYLNNMGSPRKVRIKECYPYDVDIRRDGNGYLMPGRESGEDFENSKKSFVRSFTLNNELFGAEDLTNAVTNTIDIYEANNTLYVVTAYAAGDIISGGKEYSLKEMLCIVRSAAAVLCRIHRSGYLYLDLKPENVFVYNGTKDIIQLFDFDSPAEYCEGIGVKEDGMKRLSFTRGFSAPELREGKIAHLGKYTDVYAAGALLFYMIFHRTPDALDCDEDAVYDFESVITDTRRYPDKLFFLLTDLFHMTLRSYWVKRCQNMEKVCEALSGLISLADENRTFICSSFISPQTVMIGRTAEYESLRNWALSREERCISVTGMAGIGKSTLVRRVMADTRREFDAVLYLYYDGSIERMIADDNLLTVSNLQRSGEEPEEEYYRRKVRVLKKLLQGSNVLLALDNYNREISEEIVSLAEIGFKLIVISRNEQESTLFKTIRIGRIEEECALERLMEYYLKRKLEPSERENAGKIIALVRGHTLCIELIARGIRGSHLTVDEALEICSRQGFSRLGPETLPYVKDQAPLMGTVYSIISALFETSGQDGETRTLLKMLALFPDGRMKGKLLKEVLGLPDFGKLNSLTVSGWLKFDGEELGIHPLIREIIAGWGWNEESRKSLNDLCMRLCALLRTGEEDGGTPARHLRLHLQYLVPALGVLTSCAADEAVRCEEGVINLEYRMLDALPADYHDGIIVWADDVLGKISARSTRPSAVMRIYEKTVSAHLDLHRYSEAKRLLDNACSYARNTRDPYVWGMYYDLTADYFDYRLDGRYDQTDHPYYKKLSDALDKAIANFTLCAGTSEKVRLVDCLISKINLLCRAVPEQKKKIDVLIRRTRGLMEQEKEICLRQKRDFHMAMAWYYTYTDFCTDKAAAEIAAAMHYLAEEMEAGISYTGLELIDDVYIPCGNIVFECGEFDRAIPFLQEGLRLTDKPASEEIEVYLRKRVELCMHLHEIYKYLCDEDRCRLLEEMIWEITTTHDIPGMKELVYRRN